MTAENDSIIADKLHEKKKSLENSLSKKRKEGYDLYMAELLFYQLPFDIRIYEADDTKQNLNQVERIFEEIETEMENATILHWHYSEDNEYYTL
ncbi:MAG: hypothetical protein ACOCZV_00965 [Nanoarchaeota archaeon]